MGHDRLIPACDLVLLLAKHGWVWQNAKRIFNWMAEGILPPCRLKIRKPVFSLGLDQSSGNSPCTSYDDHVDIQFL